MIDFFDNFIFGDSLSFQNSKSAKGENIFCILFCTMPAVNENLLMEL